MKIIIPAPIDNPAATVAVDLGPFELPDFIAMVVALTVASLRGILGSTKPKPDLAQDLHGEICGDFNVKSRPTVNRWVN
jgi:hypothetical protein